MRTSLLACLAALTLVSFARAQTVINTVPYTINVSGEYVLGGNLNNADPNSSAITIAVANVTLDLGGFYISGSGNTASTNAIVRINNVPNVTIRNGLIANAGYGIYLPGGPGTRNYTLENLTVSRCYLYGIHLFARSPGSVIRNNSLSNIGGSTQGGTSSATAIFVNGGVRIENNSIANVTGTAGGYSTGISGLDDDFSVGNTISNCIYGIDGTKRLNNLTSGCITPFFNGVSAMGNN